VKRLPMAAHLIRLACHTRERHPVASNVDTGDRSVGVSIEFLITSFIVIVSPGTGVLYTLAAGLSRGSRASVVAAFGCTIGIVPHMVAAILGLAALLHTSALAFQIFKYLGVAVHGVEHVARARRLAGGEGTRRPFGNSGDRDGRPDQHPQSEAVDSSFWHSCRNS
jgi:hypothetical protein